MGLGEADKRLEAAGCPLLLTTHSPELSLGSTDGARPGPGEGVHRVPGSLLAAKHGNKSHFNKKPQPKVSSTDNQFLNEYQSL